MIITREQFEKDILRLSEYVGKKPSFEIFINTKTPGLPKTVEMLVYELFIVGFDYRSCQNDLYYSYKNILDYSKELRENGSITFK